uniref:Uncharacterized protein n=1 Tax=Fusarium oxysporum (strain Fo5176) TaxID=660025 RepID=A0A0D2YDD6_FUSOF
MHSVLEVRFFDLHQYKAVNMRTKTAFAPALDISNGLDRQLSFDCVQSSAYTINRINTLFDSKGNTGESCTCKCVHVPQVRVKGATDNGHILWAYEIDEPREFLRKLFVCLAPLGFGSPDCIVGVDGRSSR